jgi:hypothetical protein
MAGETNLDVLLKNMEPCLNKGDYVFCTLNHPGHSDLHDILFWLREKEAVTVVMRKELADKKGLSYSAVMAWITLTVDSSLEAVGFTAVFSSALAAENISCNVVAGYYHDHIFVPKDKGTQAIAVLKKLATK